MQDYTLLYILGSGRCGSTLLDLLLNGHSQILGLGEVSTLNQVFKPLLTSDRMTQKFSQSYIPFWEEVKRRYETVFGASFEQMDLSHPRWRTIPLLQAEDVERWAKPNEVLLSCIHELSGAKILTDASKVSQRLYLLHRSGLFNIKVIHLVRDGRAVTNSYIQRYASFAGGLRLWITTALSSFYLRHKFKRTDWLQVRYEEFVIKPEDTLKDICTFLGANFEPGMLAYRTSPYFGVGGNPLVKNREDEQILLDERWKRDLGFKHRLIFALTAGWLNKLYGY
jgi:Sulfotransferase family